ncbi:MAG: hypothetical protein ABI794_13930 [Betaproteobacteria bacterium]
MVLLPAEPSGQQFFKRQHKGSGTMNNIVYIVGAIVIIFAILSFVGLA